MNFLRALFLIKKVERGYQIRGRYSVHKTRKKAVRQLMGMRNANS